MIGQSANLNQLLCYFACFLNATMTINIVRNFAPRLPWRQINKFREIRQLIENILTHLSNKWTQLLYFFVCFIFNAIANGCHWPQTKSDDSKCETNKNAKPLKTCPRTRDECILNSEIRNKCEKNRLCFNTNEKINETKNQNDLF